MNILMSYSRVLIIGMAAIFVLQTNAQSADINWFTPALSELVREGLENNKELQSLKAEAEGLKEKIDLAGSLPDPMLGIAILNLPTDSYKFDEQAMTQKQLSISQKFPWFGKLDLKSKQAALKAMHKEVLIEAKRLELKRKIATAYFELGMIEKSREINNRLSNMMRQIIRDAESKYATGRGLQQAIFQAQVELSKILAEEIKLHTQYRSTEDRINSLLNRAAYTQVPPPKNLMFPDITVDPDALREKALNQNPWIKAKQVQVDETKVNIDLAEKAYWPDMDFKLSYGQREEMMGEDLDDFVSAGVTMNVPLWQGKRQDKQLAAAKNDYDAAKKSYLSLVENLPHEIDAIVFEIVNIQEGYRLYEHSLIFQAKQWAKSSRADYEVGKTEFNTMINAQIRLLQFELQAEKYLYQIYQKQAELDELIGEQIR